MKAIKEDQEKLLVSAWYSLVRSFNYSIYIKTFFIIQGSTFQRREFEERLKSHENQSFLSKQRNVPSTRKQLPADPSNSSANGADGTSSNNSKR